MNNPSDADGIIIGWQIRKVSHQTFKSIMQNKHFTKNYSTWGANYACQECGCNSGVSVYPYEHPKEVSYDLCFTCLACYEEEAIIGYGDEDLLEDGWWTRAVTLDSFG